MTSFHPKSSKSSYFPYSHDGGEGGKEEDSASMVHSRPLPASPSRKPVTAEEADSLSLAMLSHGIHFPQHDGILWDRTGLTAPRYCLVERDVLPALILTRQDLLYLLQTLTMPPHSNNHDNNNNNNSKSSATQPMTTGGVECVGSVFASSELPSAHRQVLSCYPTTTASSAGGSNPSGSGGANYGFVLNQANNRQVGLDMNFTIPITRRQFASDSQVLQFDPQSYRYVFLYLLHYIVENIANLSITMSMIVPCDRIYGNLYDQVEVLHFVILYECEPLAMPTAWIRLVCTRHLCLRPLPRLLPLHRHPQREIATLGIKALRGLK